MTDRRTFLKGLLSSVTATRAFKLTATIALAPIRWIWPQDMENYGQWDREYRYYSEAKEASDKLAIKIIEELVRDGKQEI